MRALFVTLNAGGNLPPALGIAGELQRRGGEVRFLGHAPQRARIEAAGFRFRSSGRGRDYDASKPRRTLDGLLDFTAVVADKGLAADVLEDAAAEPTDVVVIDCLLYRALADAVAAGLPVAQLVHTLYRYVEAAARGPIGLVSRLRGVNGRAAVAAPRLTLVTTRPEFDAPTTPDSLIRGIDISRAEDAGGRFEEIVASEAGRSADPGHEVAGVGLRALQLGVQGTRQLMVECTDHAFVIAKYTPGGDWEESANEVVDRLAWLVCRE